MKQQLQLIQQSSIVKVCRRGEGDRGAHCSHSDGRISWHCESPSESCDWVVFMRMTYYGLSRISLVRVAKLGLNVTLYCQSHNQRRDLYLSIIGELRRGCRDVHLIEILRFSQQWLWNVLGRDTLYSDRNYSTFRKKVLIPSSVSKCKPSKRQVQWLH
jgi:hypothetical protein